MLRSFTRSSALIDALKVLLLVVVILKGAQRDCFALGKAPYITNSSEAGALGLVQGGVAAKLYVDSGDWKGVVRAVGDLRDDIKRVTGLTPVVVGDTTNLGTGPVLVGTLGKSAVIDALVQSGKIDVSAIAGKWESYVSAMVTDPLPGVAKALVIAGSDKRGTIYGIYDLSEQIGVSPWYWWADVTPTHQDALWVKAGVRVQGPPSVKFRGIFLNDEAPDLTNWIAEKFGMVTPQSNPPIPNGIANYNSAFYSRIFEALLRMRGNYLWPAMWNNAFNEDDPDNARLADEYGIVMGTSHQEPMLRAQKEWDRRYLSTVGAWNYATRPDLLESFWREGIRRNKDFESIITIGLRGANDTPMAPGGVDANRALLENIIVAERRILSEEMNPDVTKVPQLWCLYSEVQEFYEAGMRVPDDVTLLWAEDNWGNVRRLPTAAERLRSGGAGVYYHVDFHGGPRCYQWLNTNPLPKIWDQMSLAKQYGADRVWIVNVGHFRGYEVPMEYFLSLGYDTERWTQDNTGEFLNLWATREFGAEHASEIADIVAKYAKYNGRRKPELLAPTTYSLTSYGEAESVVADFKAIADKAEALNALMPATKRDAFYQLVLFPTKASALLNELYIAAGKNSLYAAQGRASANDTAADTRTLFQQDLDLMSYYNRTFANGRWSHFMDQTHLGYTTWSDPPSNTLNAIYLSTPIVPTAASLGLSVEGTTNTWPVAQQSISPSLPSFDAFKRQSHFIDIFNKGSTAFTYTATVGSPWVLLSETGGSVTKDKRLWVSIDWTRAPKGNFSTTVRITGAGADIPIDLSIVNPVEPSRETLAGFVESEGHVSIEPEHFTRKTDAGERRWQRIADYGPTLSGMRSTAPVTLASATPPTNAACLEYRMYLFTTGTADVNAIFSPSLNISPDRGVRYAVSFDDEAPQLVTLVPQGFKVQYGNTDWENSVCDNSRTRHSNHTIASAGYHTLKIWAVDPGVVLQKIVVDMGGLKPSYLGPPESFHNFTPPSFSSQPASQTVAVGKSVSLFAGATGSAPLSFQWRKDGVAIPGATHPLFCQSEFSSGDAGVYDVLVSNAFGEVASTPAKLSLGQAESKRLSAIATRSYVGTSSAVQIAGFVIGGSGPKTVLIRAGGPALAGQGVGDLLQDPQIELHDTKGVIGQNNDWSSDAVQASAIEKAAQLCLLPTWQRGSKDAAMLVTLEAGSYSAIVSGVGDTTGVALVEVYEIGNGSAARLVGLATRSPVFADDKVQIAGFVIGGDSGKRVLIRANGPALSHLSVTGVLADPQLDLHDLTRSLATNDDWSSNTSAAELIREVVNALFIDSWSSGSKDAALVTTLMPGGYSAIVSGANRSTGVAMVEVYEAP